MRYPPEETIKRHESILKAASQMFREHGFDGVSVADVMKSAGLTHGAFPAHFASKEELILACVERAMQEMLARTDRTFNSENAKTTFFSNYLSTQHRDSPQRGCAMTTLAPEIARKSGKMRGIFTENVAALIDKMGRKFFPRRRNSRNDAMAALSMLVGAITLARAIDDETLSREILNAARLHLGVAPETESPEK